MCPQVERAQREIDGAEADPRAPIDPVDRVCQLHDQCYDQRGYLDCSCDRDLVARMPAAVVHPATPPAGKVAGAAAAAGHLLFWQ